MTIRYCLCLLLLFSVGAKAAAPAGFIIRSHAEASFVDEFGVQRSATSNEVATLVQEAPGVRLEQNQSRLVVIGKAFVFPHVLTNTGNVSTRYQLEVPDTGGINDIRLFHDQSNTGQIGNHPEIRGLVSLAPDESMNILVSGTAASANTSLTLRAVVKENDRCQSGSHEQYRCFDENKDTLVVGQQAVYNLNKQMSQTTASPEETVQVELSYERLDKKVDSSRLVAIDVLPEVMTLDPTKKVWSCDNQGLNCTALKSPIATGDDGFEVKPVTVDGVNRQEVKIQLTGHQSNKKGIIKFSTTINYGFAGQTFFNRAEYYSLNEDEKQVSNRVPIHIKGAGVTVNGNRYRSLKDPGGVVIVPSAESGGVVEFINYVWNTGNQSADYRVYPDIDGGSNTFPPGSLYSLCKSNDDSSCTTFKDYPEISVRKLTPGKHQTVRLRVKLPVDIKPEYIRKDGYNIRLKAEDANNKAVHDDALNLLGHINDGTLAVDLTFGQSLKDNTSAPGKGPGPESSPLKTITAKPGSRALFETVFVNNTGKKPDSYNLRLIAAPGTSLPEGLKIQFLNRHNRPISNTGVIKGNGETPLKIAIDLPEQAKPGHYSMYIEAKSPATGEQDKLHLGINIVASEGLVLEPNGESTVAPGSFVTFSHRLANTGHGDIKGIRLVVSDDQSWQPLVYHDKNGDGQIADGESVITDPVGVAAGQVMHLVVKVFAPANASQGSRETITLKALWRNREGQDQTLAVLDIATVDNTHVTIVKEQAPWDCMSALPTHFSKDRFPARPGTCVVYRLTASNLGSERIQQVVIHDAAPNFTAFCEQSGLPKTQGRVPGQIHVSGQGINASWSDGLMPGESVVLFFGVRIE
ncbi:hypothetical protein NX722_12940 [Endozoicomonas gorgoniicola]|uniref:DUF11 domain-containing protein n=1 Tax=Endozoicomonas gorgoniicola TaxID=1234144 RepID=A0ABT3MWS4_9GAMM|nr:hypothetical protein [Endozoicomonas gorgoniicola]MCW7553513.1 hypothetical protein [Endozoicomonas gorgoniicola]